MNESLIFLIVGGVLAVGIVVALIAANANVPALVAFLAFGMLLGTDGVGHIKFSNVELAQTVGTIGLIAILFEGGLSTSLRRLREAFVPALLLSTIGVFVTAILTGVAARYLFHLSWAYSLLLAAVVSSTDSAAVFATLRFTHIRRRLARILEAESGLNDPMAIALTVGFIAWIQHPHYNLYNLGLLLVQQLGIGLLVGLILGRAAMFVFARLPHSIGAFAPVASVAAALLSFGAASLLGGSGFIAVYMVGLAIGSTPSRYRGPLTMFHEGLAFLAQVALFVILGLFAIPHQLLPVALPSIFLAVLLVVVVRPISVWLSTPFGGHLNNQEKALLGWAGLRGAVPIVLGTYVLSAHILYGDLIFNAVFFVVLVSALIQGTMLNSVARYLDVIDHLPANKLTSYTDSIEKIYFHVAHAHSIAGAHVYEVGLPSNAHITEIKRRGKYIKLDNDTYIKASDRLCVEAPYSIHPEIEDVFMRWRRRV
ncbi:MAG TPA: potassium/proton antiporter [Candidatus Bathyarchaeia archaeon]|nr:potassium/proton antiporter [Candidatus Bathyarchaeia archaeon]